jgi:hypothetical protein
LLPLVVIPRSAATWGSAVLVVAYAAALNRRWYIALIIEICPR